jgi:hypothetical protein
MENNTMDKNKNMWIWVVIAVVVIGIVIFFAMSKKDKDAELLTNGETAMDAADRSDPDGEEDVTEGSISASNGSASPQVTLSYQQALVKYKDARIQLDKTCQASPDKMTFKVGSEIMLDNRAGVSRIIKIGTPYTIKPWGFKIVKLTGTKLPTTYMIDCDGQQNVSTVTVQK